MGRASACIVVVIAACGGGDSPTLDGDGVCDPDEHCLRVAPTDGVAELPDGRLVVSWFTATEVPEIAFDVAWTQVELTEIPLASVALPTMQAWEPEECSDDPSHLMNYSIGIVSLVALDRPLVPSDLQNSELGIYGIGQGLVMWSDTACPNSGFDFELDMHAYGEDTPSIADGQVFDLDTCAPDNPDCSLDLPAGLGS